MLPAWRQPISARSFVLWALSTAAPLPERTAQLVELGSVLSLEPAATRVALGRLVREDMARATQRGTYVLGPAAAAVHAKARGWASVEGNVRAWSGAWIMVLTDHLGRIDRSRLQRCERALRLSGFMASRSGCWVRPDNLGYDLDTFRKQLCGLGLDDGAIIFNGCETTQNDDADLRALWSRGHIEAGYCYWRSELSVSADRLGRLTLREAARETLLLGQSVIRTINSDPLLPSELVDAALRAALVADMMRYDDLGRRIWAKLRAATPAHVITEKAA